MNIKNTEDMIYLMSCALNKTKPDVNTVADMDYESVFRLSKKHSVASLCWYALEGCSSALPEELAERWRKYSLQVVRRLMLMSAERKAFTDFCETAGIRYMLLKGIIMQDYYPQYGTREMADNDILADEAHRAEIRDYFAGRGYEIESFGKLLHDVYMKKPLYHFEIHQELFGEYYSDTLREYYSDVFPRLLHDKGSEYGYHFSPEDFYVFVMAHAYRHYSGGGTGIRSLADCYVMRRSMTLDDGCVDREMKKLGIYDFGCEAAAVSEKLFSEPDKVYERIDGMDGSELDTLEFYISSGTYGTMSNAIEKRLEEMSGGGKTPTVVAKLKFIWKRIFPGKKHMRLWCISYAPFFIRHDRLMWLAPFWRLLTKGPMTEKSRKELKVIRDQHNKNA